MTASAPSEETLPHLHQAISSFLPAWPMGQAWLPAGVVWHQKAPVPGVAGALGTRQPAMLHLPTQQLPAWAQGSTGALECLAQPWHLQLSPECTNFSGNPGKPFFCLASTGHSQCKVLEDPSKGFLQRSHSAQTRLGLLGCAQG